MPEWLDLSLRIAGAVVVIGGIMWLAFRAMPGRDRDKSRHLDTGFGDGGPSHDGGGDASGHGGS
jgi:hypothetical protein